MEPRRKRAYHLETSGTSSSSGTTSDSCKNTQVLLNKDTWAVFIHFLKTQCEDQTVFINLACSNFLLESNTLEDGSVIFAEDPLWRGATMTFAHIFRDKDESIVTVNLAELNMLGGNFYKMDKETFLELVCVSRFL